MLTPRQKEAFLIIVDHVVRTGQPMGVRTLHREMPQVSLNTTHRKIMCLVERGYVGAVYGPRYRKTGARGYIPLKYPDWLEQGREAA